MLTNNNEDWDVSKIPGNEPPSAAAPEPVVDPAPAPATGTSAATENQPTGAPAPPDPAKVTPSFNENDWLKEKFGDGITIDILKEAKEKASKIPDYEKKVAELESKLKEDPFPDEYAKKEAEFVKKGGDRRIFREVNEIDLDKMTAEDAVRKKIKLENPDLSEKDIARLLKKDYMIAPEYDEAITKNEDPDLVEKIEDARLKLKIDGKDAKKILGEYKVKNSAPPVNKEQEALLKQKEDAERNTATMLKTWEDSLSKITSEKRKMTIALNDQGAVMEYVFDDVDPKEQKEELLAFAKMAGVPYGDEVKPHVETFIKNTLMQKQSEKIFKAVAKAVRDMTDAEWRKEVHNPSAINKGDTPPPPAPSKLKEEIAKLNEAWS